MRAGIKDVNDTREISDNDDVCSSLVKRDFFYRGRDKGIAW